MTPVTFIGAARVLSADLRRGLILITKVLQNLANKVMFTKEPYMEEMNPFLKTHMDTITDLFNRFAVSCFHMHKVNCHILSNNSVFLLFKMVPKSSDGLTGVQMADEQREEDLASLHYYLSVNLENIRKVLTSVDSKV